MHKLLSGIIFFQVFLSIRRESTMSSPVIAMLKISFINPWGLCKAFFFNDLRATHNFFFFLWWTFSISAWVKSFVKKSLPQCGNFITSRLIGMCPNPNPNVFNKKLFTSLTFATRSPLIMLLARLDKFWDLAS